MTIIKNYNSHLALSEYEIGNVYSFYLGNNHLSYPNHFNEKPVEKYIEILTDVINSNQEFTNSDGKYFNYPRAIGVVIEKKSDINNSLDSFRKEKNMKFIPLSNINDLDELLKTNDIEWTVLRDRVEKIITV